MGIVNNKTDLYIIYKMQNTCKSLDYKAIWIIYKKVKKY